MNEDTPPPAPSSQATPLAVLGLGLLFASVFLGRGPEPGLLVYVGRSLFVLGLVAIGAAVSQWYRDAQHPEKERDPEV